MVAARNTIHHGALASRKAVSVGAITADLLRRNEFRTILGSVVGTFSSGSYVCFGTDVIAVGAIPAGPLHMVIDRPVGVHEGDICAIGEDQITIAGHEMDLRNTPRWSPRLPDRTQVAAFATKLNRLDPDLVGVPDLSSVWSEVIGSVAGGASEKTKLLLQGRGSGLTPTGDDVIGGLMLFDAWMNPGLEDEEHRTAYVSSIRTTSLSRSFLAFAAKGHSIEPVHKLIGYATSGDDEQFSELAKAISQIGGSSGRALLAGLQLKARLSPYAERGPRPVG